MNLKIFQNKEYESTLYGFSVEYLCLKTKNMIEDAFTKNAKQLEQGLCLKGGKFSDEEKLKISSDIDNLIAFHLELSADGLKRIESNIQNYLHIPDNVLLADDVLHSQHYTDKDVSKIKHEIQCLEKRALRAKVMKTQLEAELKIYNENEESLKKLQQCYSMMNKQNHENSFDYEKFTAILKNLNDLQEIKLKFSEINELKFDFETIHEN